MNKLHHAAKNPPVARRAVPGTAGQLNAETPLAVYEQA